jgi:hypothetical protein
MNAGPTPEEWEQDDFDDAGLNIDVLRRRRERVLTFLALFFIAVVSLFVLRALLQPRPVDRMELIVAAKLAVRNAVPAGSVLTFSTLPEFLIQMEDPNLYTVKGEVVLVTHEGHSSHFFFECSLTRSEEGQWLPVRLSVNPG